MKIKYLILLLLMLNSTLVYAEDIQGIDLRIKNNSIFIRGFLVTDFVGKVSADIINEVNETISSSPIICDAINIVEGNITKTYQQNCTLNLNFHKEIQLKLNSTSNKIIGDTELQRKFEDCLVDKASFNAGLNSCTEAKNQRQDYEVNFTKCSTDLTICQSDRSNIDSRNKVLQEESDKNKNRHWIWGIAGVILGIIAVLYRDGRILGPKTKNPEESYNTMQAS